MMKKLLSGFALALACMGSSQALVLTSADTPLTFNVQSLASSNFNKVYVGWQDVTDLSFDIAGGFKVFSGLDGTGTLLFSDTFTIFSYNGPNLTWQNPDPTELVDGFSIVAEISAGAMTLSLPGDDPRIVYSVQGPCVGKDCQPTVVNQGFLTPVRRALTNNVPEPGTLLLVAIGAVAFAAVRQRPA